MILTKKLVESFHITQETGIRLYAEMLILATKSMCPSCGLHLVHLTFTEQINAKFTRVNSYLINEIRFAAFCSGLLLMADETIPMILLQAATTVNSFDNENEAIMEIEKGIREQIALEDNLRQQAYN